MKKNFYLIIALLACMFSSCDVHEFPDLPDMVQFHLRLNYDTDMTIWNHNYVDKEIVEEGYGETYDNHQTYGKIRYIVRVYPANKTDKHVQEYVFTKNINEGYDHGATLQLIPGDYDIYVWSDLIERSSDSYFYNATNFSNIMLQGEHKGNTNHRDAFSGSNTIQLVSTIVDRAPDTLDITMKRPMAKYEFISTDLQEFIDKEVEYLSRLANTRGETPPTRVDTDDYKVVLYFSAYMPSAYDIFADLPIDSKLNVYFESKMNVLNANEASIGFDYVFINNEQSAVDVRIGVFDKEDRQLALSESMRLPLKRSNHTVLKGSFLMQQASGGITINPEFENEHNIVIK